MRRIFPYIYILKVIPLTGLEFVSNEDDFILIGRFARLTEVGHEILTH